ncbi:MAG: SDR family oxidoreductase [Candidatus Hydrogenedentes bacterium]|nr:SDR family oxidoreductase [Candidatus Hydrogenedentota bacterium]
MQNVLIAGCGYVGISLAYRLMRDGYRVFGLRRHTDFLPPEVHAIKANLRDLESLRPMPEYFDFVFYTASADHYDEVSYQRAYVDGLWNLLEALQNEGERPKRIIYTSSTGVSGQQDGELVDEDSPTDPTSPTGRCLIEGETLLHDSMFESVVVRLAGIYGPGRTRVIDRVRDGDAQCVKDRTTMLNHIHRDDCAGVLQHVMTLEKPAKLYLAVDNEPADLCEAQRWIAKELGVPEPPVVPADQAPARVRGGNRRYSNRRLLESGYEFQYPTYREGYASLLHH